VTPCSQVDNRAGGCIDNALRLYPGGAWFEFRLVYRTPAVVSEVIRGFTQYIPLNIGIVSLLGHNRFLPNSFRFIIHQSPYHFMLFSLDTNSVAKWNTKRSLLMSCNSERFRRFGGTHVLLHHGQETNHQNPGGKLIAIYSSETSIYLIFEVLAAVVMKSTIFWDTTPYSPLNVNRRYGGTYSLNPQGRKNKLSKKPAWKQVEIQAGFLLNLFFGSWRWRRYIPPKRQLTLNKLHCVISQKLVLSVYLLFVLLLELEDGGHMFLRNVHLSPNYTLLQRRRPYFSLQSPPWEPKSLQVRQIIVNVL
jgi:hypothetical protein